jgi:hypothetical protein
MNFVKRFFDIYNIYFLGKAKNLALKYTHLPDVSRYSIGTNPLIDEKLDDIWAHKKYPHMQIRNLEIELCKQHITLLKMKIKRSMRGVITLQPINELENEIKKYQQKIKLLESYKD